MTIWVTLEGLNGVGKTHYARRLAAELGGECQLLDELTDTGDKTASTIIAEMMGGGTFLRTGFPLTETFVLASLKVREYERVASLAKPPPIVLEDRGMDTVAVYQAAILAGAKDDNEALLGLAERIAGTARMWRPQPSLTFLLTGDLDSCLDRYAERTGMPVSEPDRGLLDTVNSLYGLLAASEPDRWVVCPTNGRSDSDVLGSLRTSVFSIPSGKADG
jgi:dTMP kinase